MQTILKTVIYVSLININILSYANFIIQSDAYFTPNKQISYIKKSQHRKPKNLWSIVQNSTEKCFQYRNSDLTKHYINWFAKHQYALKNMLSKATPYLHYIIKQIKLRKMPIEIAMVPAVESSFDPFALSNGLASGLWQITPSTGKYYKIQQNWWYDGRRDIIVATHFALDYLQELYRNFNDWELALAAYNSGKRTVTKAIEANRKMGKPINYENLKLPVQTIQYVPKIRALANIIHNPYAYNLKLPYIPDKPFFTIIKTTTQIDLQQLSQYTHTSLSMLRQLNPGFNRQITAPDTKYLLVPIEQKKMFKQIIKKLSDEQQINWHRYIVQPTDTLNKIAKQFKTTSNLLAKINQLHEFTIYPHETLLIPQANNKAKMNAQQKKLALKQIHNIGLHITNKIPHIHIVKTGETLWSIAKNYKISIQQINQWNKLTNNKIYPKNKLILWLGHHNKIQEKYTVKKNDNLYNIAMQNNCTVSQLCQWNSLQLQSILLPKQVLTIWKSSRNHGKKHPGSIIRKIIYTVRKQENIEQIANKFNVTANEIAYWNNLTTTNLTIGQTLIIFTDITLTS